MFKFVLVSSVLLATAATLPVNSTDEEPTSIVKTATLFMERRCGKNGGENAFADLIQDRFVFWISSFIVAWGMYTSVDRVQEKEDWATTCTNITQALDSPIGSYMGKLDACLDKEEKYLTTFLPEFYNFTKNALCEDGGEKVKDYVNNYKDFKTCKVFGERYDKTIATCFPLSGIIQELETPNFILTKDTFCKKFIDGKECVLSEIKKHCKKRVEDFYDFHMVNPVKNWCKESNDI